MPVREPDAENSHVRFDEREVETELRIETRHRRWAKAAGNGNSSVMPPSRHFSTLPALARQLFGCFPGR